MSAVAAYIQFVPPGCFVIVLNSVSHSAFCMWCGVQVSDQVQLSTVATVTGPIILNTGSNLTLTGAWLFALPALGITGAGQLTILDASVTAALSTNLSCNTLVSNSFIAINSAVNLTIAATLQLQAGVTV